MTATFKTTAIRCAAALTVAGALAGQSANAQDWTGIDLNAMNNGWNLDHNAMMQAQLNQIIWDNMNNPQVQAMYQQQVAQGLFWGTLEEFAYKVAYTGGMTAEGSVVAVDRSSAFTHG